MSLRRPLLAVLLSLLALAAIFPGLALAQEGFPLFTTDFPPEEFAARRAKVYEAIGTDAIAVEGLDAAIERAHAYAAAGADVLFVEAPTSEAQIEAIARSLPGAKLINMFEGGKTPLVPLARLQALGYRIVIVPSDLQRAAIRAMQEVLAVMRRDGNSRALAGRMATFDEREAVVRTREYLELDRRYGA